MFDPRSSQRPRWRHRVAALRLAPDGRPRPDAPFGRGPAAARVLGHVIDAAAFVGASLPARVAHALAVAGGHAEWAMRPGKRRRLAANLTHALGGAPPERAVRRAVRREMVNEARRSADLLWAIGRPQEFLATADITGREHLAARGDRGVILAGLHLGGWEVAATVPAAIVPVPTSVLVADNWLAWGIQHVRAAAGLRMIYRTSPPLVAAHLLRRGESVLILGDDATGVPPRSHRVRFADAEADLPAGIVSLARIGRAVIVPFSVLPLAPRRWRVCFEPAIPPPADRGSERATMQVLADRWTALVQAHPEQWAASFPIHWVQPA